MTRKIEIFKDVLETTYAGTSGWLSKAISGYTKEELELTQKTFLSAHIEEAFIDICRFAFKAAETEAA